MSIWLCDVAVKNINILAKSKPYLICILACLMVIRVQTGNDWRKNEGQKSRDVLTHFNENNVWTILPLSYISVIRVGWRRRGRTCRSCPTWRAPWPWVAWWPWCPRRWDPSSRLRPSTRASVRRSRPWCRHPAGLYRPTKCMRVYCQYKKDTMPQ